MRFEPRLPDLCARVRGVRESGAGPKIQIPKIHESTSPVAIFYNKRGQVYKISAGLVAGLVNESGSPQVRRPAPPGVARGASGGAPWGPREGAEKEEEKEEKEENVEKDEGGRGGGEGGGGRGGGGRRGGRGGRGGRG